MKKHNIIACSAMVMAMVSANAATKPSLAKLNISNICPTGLFQGNMTFIDANNDGNLELLVKGRDVPSGWATTIRLLSGDGYGYNAGVTINDPDGCSWQRVVVPIDYNADGNMDFILGNSWNAKLMQGDGSGNFTMVDTQVFKLDGEISIDGDDSEKWYTGLTAVADFNGDGYPDIVTFCGNPREDQGEPVLFINKGGTGEFEKMAGVGLNPQRGGTIAVGDFNNDGYPDLAVAGWIDNDRIRLYRNDGKGFFEETMSAEFDALDAGTEKGYIMFADFDNDGWLDLFVTGESCPQGWAKQAAVYKNNGGTSFTKMNTGELPGVKASGADWGDLNGDGLVDIIYAGEGDNGQISVVAYANGDGTFTAVTDLIAGHRGGASVAIADFNNNLKPDAAVMGYGDGDLFELYNNATSRGTYAAPGAPSDATCVADGNKTVFSWEAGSDKVTPVEALRYNLYVKTTDGRIFCTVPADPATGKLRQGDVSAASTARTRTLNIKKEDIAEWGVQTINSAKLTSAFTKGADSSAVNEIEGISLGLRYSNGILTTG
ncbi:MAG: VCBS repeat-containing protein, partial [Muribaculaceae bacterium]|nr:VCBS repeat-containing protein [Muribaculaceae bacterium]